MYKSGLPMLMHKGCCSKYFESKPLVVFFHTTVMSGLKTLIVKNSQPHHVIHWPFQTMKALNCLLLEVNQMNHILYQRKLKQKHSQNDYCIISSSVSLPLTLDSHLRFFQRDRSRFSLNILPELG